MKNLSLKILGIFVMYAQTSAIAGTQWHSVLSCDDGAAVIDNRDTWSNGRMNAPATTAQIVVRNPQIVDYFRTALAMDAQPGDSYRIVDGQWISALPPQATFSAGERVTNFTVYGVYGAKITVSQDGVGLKLNVITSQKQTANWHFQYCRVLFQNN